MSNTQSIKSIVGDAQNQFVEGEAILKFTGMAKTANDFDKFTFSDTASSDRWSIVYFDNSASHNAIKELKLKPNDFFRIKGGFKLSPWGDKGNFNLNIADDCEISQPTKDEIPVPPEPQEVRENAIKWFTYIKEAIDRIDDITLNTLTKHMWGSWSNDFSTTAAARGHHHAHRRGLMEHVYEMLVSGEALAKAYELNQKETDLLITGIIWHDVGKLWETKHVAGSPEPTKKGILLGHMGVGCQLLYHTASECGIDWFDNDLIDNVAHIIYSHHGSASWGSPVNPATVVARIVHDVDNMSASTNKLKGIIADPSNGICDEGYYSMKTKQHAVDLSTYD